MLILPIYVVRMLVDYFFIHLFINGDFHRGYAGFSVSLLLAIFVGIALVPLLLTLFKKFFLYLYECF